MIRFVLLLLVLPAIALGCGTSVAPWNTSINFIETEKFLASATPRKVMPMADYLRDIGKQMTGESESYYVEFSDTVAAIFKPEDELWDSYGEVGAYIFSQRMNLPYVPPTILRELSSKHWTGKRTGSLQYFIRTSNDTSKLTPTLFRQKVGEEVWSRLVSIAYPLGQWDFYGGNLILDDSGTPALIDNAAIMDLLFFKYGDFPYIHKGRNLPSRLAMRLREFPYDSVQHLENPSMQVMRTSFRPFVGEPAISRWFRKLDTFPNRTFSYILWENTLWLHWKKRGLASMTVTRCEPELTQRLLQLTPQVMRDFMPPAFSAAHLELIYDRSLQFSAACQAL